MPLPYETRKPLDLTELAYNADDIATLVVSGTRYGGEWGLNALVFADGKPVSYDPVGEIFTLKEGDSAMAFDTAFVWVNDACVKAGVKLAHAEDRNHERPADEQPYFATGMFLIDRRQSA